MLRRKYKERENVSGFPAHYISWHITGVVCLSVGLVLPDEEDIYVGLIRIDGPKNTFSVESVE